MHRLIYDYAFFAYYVKKGKGIKFLESHCMIGTAIIYLLSILIVLPFIEINQFTIIC